MSAEEKLIQRIISAGSIGVKKTELRKEFAETETDTILEHMVTNGDVFIDKKGAHTTAGIRIITFKVC